MAYRKAFAMQKQWSVRLSGASTNEQKVVEMPRSCHERILTEAMNRWIGESMFQFKKYNHSMKQGSNKRMNRWINSSTTSWVSKAKSQCHSESIYHCLNDPMSKWQETKQNETKKSKLHEIEKERMNWNDIYKDMTWTWSETQNDMKWSDMKWKWTEMN